MSLLIYFLKLTLILHNAIPQNKVNVTLWSNICHHKQISCLAAGRVNQEKNCHCLIISKQKLRNFDNCVWMLLCGIALNNRFSWLKVCASAAELSFLQYCILIPYWTKEKSFLWPWQECIPYFKMDNLYFSQEVLYQLRQAAFQILLVLLKIYTKSWQN